MGWRVLDFATIDSTQDKVIELVSAGSYEEKTFVVAQHQLRGRGRSNTTWKSAAGCLTFSYAMQEPQAMLSILANIQKTLATFGVFADLKWPNDVLVCGRKVCGTIVDVCGAFSVVGIGINLRGDIEYATVERLVGKEIAQSDFLAAYAMLCEVRDIPDIRMPDVWLGNEICRVKSVGDNHLVLADCHGREMLVSAHEYSYLSDLHRIVKK